MTSEGGHFPALIRPEIERPGSYQWFKAFQSYPAWSGEIKHVNEIANADFQKYDIVHMNLSGVSTKYYPEIRRQLRGSSTKFILNLDYPPEMVDVSPWITNTQSFYDCFRAVDFCFAQIPHQQSFLDAIWRRVLGRKETVPVIPHPVDTSLKQLAIDPKDRIDTLAIMWHRYDGHLLVPSMLAKATPARGDFKGVRVQVPSNIFGFANMPIDLTMFDLTTVHKDWDQYVYLLSHCTIGLSYYTISSQDRFCAETACLGIPTVTTDRSYFGRLLFPKCSFQVENLNGMLGSLEKLKTNPSYWESVRSYAAKKVEEYNLKRSVDRLLGAMRKWDLKI